MSCSCSKCNVEFKKIIPDAKMPWRKRETDAGYDIASSIDYTLYPGECYDVPTGLIVAVGPGWYITVDGRSSMSKNHLSPFRGILDSGYIGELKVALTNIGKEKYEIKKGDRIAQLIFHRHHPTEFKEVDKFSPEFSSRGEAGWGSSGR